MRASGRPPRYHSFVRIPNRSARAFVSDVLSAIYTRRARDHACVRRGWIQSGFAFGGDGWERKMAFADSRYLHSVLAKIVEGIKLKRARCTTLIRILTYLSILLNNSRALHLCFNFFLLSSCRQNLFDISYLQKIQKIVNKMVFFYFHACWSC